MDRPSVPGAKVRARAPVGDAQRVAAAHDQIPAGSRQHRDPVEAAGGSAGPAPHRARTRAPQQQTFAEQFFERIIGRS